MKRPAGIPNQTSRGAGAVSVAIVLCLLSACASPQSSSDELTAIAGATLIDGTGDEPTADAVVLISGGKVLAAGSRREVEIPSHARLVDATGKTLIPGLIDLHSHYGTHEPWRANAVRQLAAQLALGVTTARSTGLDRPETFTVLEEVRDGVLPGPRVVTCGVGFSGGERGKLPWQQIRRRPKTPGEVRDGVSEVLAEGGDCLKVWVNGALSDEILAAIAHEANQRTIPVIAHVRHEAAFHRAVGVGVTDLLHTVTDADVGDPTLAKAVVEYGVSFTPTLTPMTVSLSLIENADLWTSSEELRATLPPDLAADLQDPDWRRQRLADPAVEGERRQLASAQGFTLQMYRAGAPIFVGSDSFMGLIRSPVADKEREMFYVPHGWATHTEMRLLVEAGIPALDVISMATGKAARHLGIESLGTIEAGSIADLVVLDANPVENITNTLRIHRIMQAGRWVDRRALLGLD